MRDRWITKLSALHTAKTSGKGVAPHKPLMLLALMDLIENGEYADGWVIYDIRLTQQFRFYWPHVAERQKNQPDITMPFHALGGKRDQVWERFTEDGEPSQARQTTRRCRLNPELHALLQDSTFRREARIRLVAGYFTELEQISLCEHLDLPLPDNSTMENILLDRETDKRQRIKGRDARFKATVLPGYRYTCLLTGYQLQTENKALVVAAHIHPHSLAGNDDPRNGLTLCPNAHWAFDEGLWTLTPKGEGYLITVASEAFVETGPADMQLGRLHQKPLCWPAGSTLRPDPEAIAWHRRRVFLGTR